METQNISAVVALTWGKFLLSDTEVGHAGFIVC